MTAVVILTIGCGLGLGVLAAVIWALWKHPYLPRLERIGLGLLGAGLVWGGINRAMGRPVDIGDLLLLLGLGLVLWRYFKHQPRIEAVK